MVDTIVGVFLWATGVLGLVALFLPLWLMWRGLLAALCCFAGMWLANGPVHWTDQDYGYFTMIFVFNAFWLVVLGGAAIRLVIAGFQKRLTAERLGGPGWVRLDAALCDLVGLILGCWLFGLLANLLAGSGVGPGFDWAVAAIGLAASVGLTVLAFRRRSLFPVVPAATFGVIGALAIWGAGQPDRILAQAELLADGRDWCLAERIGSDPIDGPAQLGFFGMAKGGFVHHLGLVAGSAEDFEAWHWSIRRQRFFDGFVNAHSVGPPCDPGG